MTLVVGERIIGAPERRRRGRHASEETHREGLYDWQREALLAWSAAAHRGVVEAVTGSGKTRLAIAAIEDALGDGLDAVVLVPTIELQTQWRRELAKLLPDARVGALGGGRRDGLGDHHVLVALVNSAAGAALPNAVTGTLLVADECHRYATPTFSRALHDGYVRRLGLTATLEREDGGHERYLDAFFSGVAYRLWYDRALRDGVIAPFDIAMTGVPLDPSERTRYDECTDGMERTSLRLRQLVPGLRDLPSVEFLKRVSELAASEARSPEVGAARGYMSNYGSRRSVLAESDAKFRLLAGITEVIAEANGSLVFTQTKQSAHAVTAGLEALGVTTTAIHSDLNPGERRSRLDEFRDGRVSLIAAPRVLDEGVDVPEADLGVIVAANRSKRQLVQRLGRVIRRKLDGRPGRLVVLYAAGTVEDPGLAGDTHLNSVLPHARSVEWFDAPQDVDALIAFLRASSLDRVAPLLPDDDPDYTGRHAVGARPAPEMPQQRAEHAPGPAVLVGERPAAGRPAIAVPVDAKSDVDADGESDEDQAPPDDKSDWEEPEERAAAHRASRAAELARSEDSLRTYRKQIGRQPLLTAEQEVSVARRIEVGMLAQERLDSENSRAGVDDAQLRADLGALVIDGAAAKETLISANLRLVISIAQRYTGQGLAFLDAIQEGNLGLIRAVQKFDYTQGNKFSTYATWWIRQAITRGLADQGRVIRLPVHVVEQLNSLRSARLELTTRDDQAPTEAAVAGALDVSTAKVRELDAISRPTISWDQLGEVLDPWSDGGSDIIDEHATRAANDAGSSLIDDLEQVIALLPAREARVIRLRFGFETGEAMTLEQIGTVFGFTRERARQIEVSALKLLRYPERHARLRPYLDALA